ncbi:SunT ABC-type bacteriocin/lantibiotic exporters, contain an N-terminal double-glycine peptidase domain [Candidatus Nanopelagicaceae bacterium]
MNLSLKAKWRNSTLGRSSRVLTKRDQKKTIAFVVLQVSLGIFDLLGVVAIGILGALAVNGVKSGSNGSKVEWVLKTLNLDGLTFQQQTAALGVISVGLLVTRTILSVIVSRKILYFLSSRGARISSMLVAKLLSESLLVVNRRSVQSTVYSLTEGVYAITIGVLSSTIIAISDASLLIVLTIALFVADPIVACTSTILFTAIGLALHRLQSVRAKIIGAKYSELSIKSNEKINEVLNSYREAVVRNRRAYYSNEIGSLRLDLAKVTSEMGFMPNLSKYVIESSVIVGALLIAAIQFVVQDAVHAVATLAIFIAAGSRIAPALLRVQQNLIQVKNSLGTANPTLDLIDELIDSPEQSMHEDEAVNFSHTKFTPKFQFSNASFRYPGKNENSITNITLKIEPGTVVALVGPSGSGKTTLIDLLLGILQPTSGWIHISDMSASQAVIQHPGAIAYVPQNVYISNGSIQHNVTLGFPENSQDSKFIWDALGMAHLSEYVLSLPNKLEEEVGENGNRLSGGQRQRLGIARAVFTKPKMLVLDEATSALDGQSEAEISQAISDLKGTTTLVIVAHRLSTVRDADVVVYLDKGEIVAKGTFSEVRATIPDFDNQAKLMGL